MSHVKRLQNLILSWKTPHKRTSFAVQISHQIFIFQPLKIIPKECIFTMVHENTDCSYYKVTKKSWSFHHSPS